MQIIRFSDSIISLRVACGDYPPFLPIPGELLAVHSLRMFHKFPRDKGLSDAGIILKN
jgi:hypothetical protein